VREVLGRTAGKGQTQTFLLYSTVSRRRRRRRERRRKRKRKKRNFHYTCKTEYPVF
jgi:hypothetical protein